MTCTTYTNPETAVRITVTVHEVFEQHGQTVARVNKGNAKTPLTFIVRAADLDLVLA